MRKNFHEAIMLFVLILLTTSCINMLNAGCQKNNETIFTADAKVSANGGIYRSEGVLVEQKERDCQTKRVKIECEGFKPNYKVHYHSSRVSDKEILDLHKRKDDEKYVYLKNATFNVKNEDLKLKTIKRDDFNKKNNKYKIREIDVQGLKFDNAIFSDEVTQVLKKNNYLDTTNTIFKSYSNAMYISAKITKLEFDEICDYEAKTVKNFFISKLEIEWEMFDLYNQSKHKQIFSAESGEFSSESDKSTALRASMEDAIAESFFKFMATAEVKKLIEKKNNNGEEKQELLKIIKPAAITNFEEAMEATVTVKVKEGHGSGCFITNDGYIVTNFRLVFASEKITVITKDGKEYTAKIVHKNENSDLALLKIEATTKHAFTLPLTKNYKISDEIFAIGTPKSIELGQSLSKGIISGFRTFDKNNFIQTDAGVNGGNSGGPLINREGQFIGVVNAKVFGVGIEGLGFAIPAEVIQDELNISY